MQHIYRLDKKDYPQIRQIRQIIRGSSADFADYGWKICVICVICGLYLFFFLFLAGCGGGDEGAPSILFLRQPGEGGAGQLFVQPLDGKARQLTGVGDPTAPEVIDYTPAPDGERIVYATQMGSDTALRLIESDGGGDRLLLDCPAAECAAPVWSPDGERLLYERRPWVDGAFGTSRLYWLGPDTGQTTPLLDEDTPGYGARYSPDGAWLSYVSPADEGVVLYRLSDGTQRLLLSRVGSPAAFSPDSAAVIVSDLVPLLVGGDDDTPPEETWAALLYRTLLTEDEPRQRLSPETAVTDNVPAYSPDGQWIAFGRVLANSGASRKLWLMRPDGSEARLVTPDPAVTYGPPSWSADGRFLLYQRLDYAEPSLLPSVWLLEVETGEETLVAEDGYLPVWLPSP